MKQEDIDYAIYAIKSGIITYRRVDEDENVISSKVQNEKATKAIETLDEAINMINRIRNIFKFQENYSDYEIVEFVRRIITTEDKPDGKYTQLFNEMIDKMMYENNHNEEE